MRILVYMPLHDWRCHRKAARAFYRPIGPDSPHTAIIDDSNVPSSLLPDAFNFGWCHAVNCYRRGEIEAWGLIHSDMGAETGWVDILERERAKVNADVISAVVPIRDETGPPRGMTSTAVDSDDWGPRRLTMHEVHNLLPETFTSDDTQQLFGFPLLLNTGLMLVKMRPEFVEPPFGFHLMTGVGPGPQGQIRMLVQPEDWIFSRDCRKRGLRLAATRAVKLTHGDGDLWDNQKVRGQQAGSLDSFRE